MELVKEIKAGRLPCPPRRRRLARPTANNVLEVSEPKPPPMQAIEGLGPRTEMQGKQDTALWVLLRTLPGPAVVFDDCVLRVVQFQNTGTQPATPKTPGVAGLEWGTGEHNHCDCVVGGHEMCTLACMLKMLLP